MHTASPCHTNASDPSEIITPAVAGTTGIITSVSIHGHNVRRVVVLSSIAAVWEPHSSPRTYSEDNWNQTSIDEVEKKGKDADGVMKYMASKTLAEKAAWDFFERHKVSLNWDLVVLNPSFVFGPAIHSVDSMSSLNSSASVWFTSVLEGTTNSTTTFSYVAIYLCFIHADAFL